VTLLDLLRAILGFVRGFLAALGEQRAPDRSIHRWN